MSTNSKKTHRNKEDLRRKVFIFRKEQEILIIMSGANYLKFIDKSDQAV